MSLTSKQIAFLDAMTEAGVEVADSYSRAELNEVAQDHLGLGSAPAWIVQDSARRVERGYFSVPEYTGVVRHLPDNRTASMMLSSELDKQPHRADSSDTMIIGTTVVKHEQGVPAQMNAIMGMTGGERRSLVPDRMSDFVQWGHFRTIRKVVESRHFAPIFVTGLSGNGKTTMIEQACAAAKRECYRVNITQETDEDDLIGGFRLLNGATVFVYGPVVEAMKNGSVLLLDEIDLASSKIMCLQPVLEGKGVFVKKTGEWITPAKGFTVIATANTKGKGDEDGRFVGTNVLNEAFLDRFDWTMEQDYATRATETKILLKKMEKYGKSDADFADYLTRWAEITRKAYKEGAIDEIITTRRLENICKAYAIFDDRATCIDLALARFDADTQAAFRNLYEKVDESIAAEATASVDPAAPTGSDVSETALNA